MKTVNKTKKKSDQCKKAIDQERYKESTLEKKQKRNCDSNSNNANGAKKQRKECQYHNKMVLIVIASLILISNVHMF